MIRLAIPDIDDDDIASVVAVLRSGMLVQSQHVAAFERAVAEYVGTRHAIAVSSGTAALHLSLLALNVGRGDQVAVPCYSWPATANAVVVTGAEPVFLDIDPSTFNLALPAFAHRARQHSRLKAVIPVHAFGSMADMAAVLDIARRHGLAVVEDAACALGASLHGRHAGAWGRLGCFSFHPRKVITTGEGGIVTTDDDDLADRVRSLRNHGLATSLGTQNFVAAGFNYRMTDFQGALGLTQLRKLERLLAARRSLASRYECMLAGTGITGPTSLAPEAHTYQSYVVQLPDDRGPDVIAALRAAGIEASIGTHHIPLTTFFARDGGFGPGDFPGADIASRRAVALPFHLRLSEADQACVAKALIAAAQLTGPESCG